MIVCLGRGMLSTEVLLLKSEFVLQLKCHCSLLLAAFMQQQYVTIDKGLNKGNILCKVL